jgi:tetratricopeptide (TPR) repeat protein
MSEGGIVSKKKQPTKKAKSRKISRQKQVNSKPAEPLPSFQSTEGLLSDVVGQTSDRKRSAVDEAQEVMYDAWEAPTRLRAINLAKKALTISADCADAYNLLAQETAESLEDAIDLYSKGVKAGERALGKKTFKQEAGYFWGILETRPYMRARAGLAECLLATGKVDEAVKHYQGMLKLNPNDNQGIRYLLMPCLIALARIDEAEELLVNFEDDASAFWVYSRALMDFIKHGDSPVAGKSLRNAIDENQYAPPYLLGRKKLPREVPEYYGFGDDNEAVVYAFENRGLWEAIPGAMDWLAASLE